ncbi:site-specific integrase [Nocardiopsis halophila]|uniref:site-specific integrase n=1 Tax=Nocardiopsis halophila TaxID=141692 RepID=UPI00034AEE12|nr:tyrosine-type recombinase/integrase [Nocardiopsis halophila]
MSAADRDGALLPALPASPVGQVEPLSASAAEDLLAGWAPNTRRAYAADWRRFAAWCAGHGRTALPASAATLVEYFSARARADPPPAPATLRRALAAIRALHELAEHPLASDKAAKVISGHARSLRRRKRRAHAITTEELRAMVAARPGGDLRSLRDRTALVLGYHLLGRRSEVCALDVGDIDFTAHGLEVYIAASKTDRQGAGARVQVGYGRHLETCPVRTTGAYLAALAEAGVTSGPLLRGIDRHGRLAGAPAAAGRPTGGRMDPRSFGRIIKGLAEEAGLSGVSAHSLRAGPATALAEAGVDRAHIARRGRWAPGSSALEGYVRPAEDRARDPFGRLDL